MENNQARSTNFNDKISWPVRLSYAGGDVACNIVFGMVGTLLTTFYTKSIGVAIGTVGLILLLSRIFDGISDVVMGIIVDKTKSRFGKARPWLLWMSLPFCISAVLLFTVPPGSGNDWWQILYIFITYNFCNTICYTAINLPYGTLSTLMTNESHERDMLGNVRMGLSPLGKIISASLTLPVALAFGNGKQYDQAAWIKTMSIWAAIAFVLLIINFLTCKENAAIPMHPEKKNIQTKLPIKKACKFLFTNQYFWAVLVLWMFQSVSFGVIGTILPYLCTDVLEANNIGISGANLYSALFLVETLVLVGGVFICMPLVKKVGKRNLALIGGFIALAGQLIYAISPLNVGMLYMSCIVRSIGLAPLNAVVFGMMGDVVDFGHWKNGFRQESFICAGGSVGTKLGSGLASVLITQMLNAAGYVSGEGQVQTEGAQTMIKNLYIISPIIIAVGVIAVLIFYKLDKHYNEMMVELKAREAKLTKEAMEEGEKVVNVLEKIEQMELEEKLDIMKKNNEKKNTEANKSNEDNNDNKENK